MMNGTEQLGRFGHHADPAIDFCMEVQDIEALLCSSKGTPAARLTGVQLRERVARAMEFRVGGDKHAVNAKQILRGIEKALTAENDANDGPISNSVFLSNLHYFFGQTDGSYALPAGSVGDLLKQAKRELEGRAAPKQEELRARIRRESIFDFAESVGAEIDGGEPSDRSHPGTPPTFTFTDSQLNVFASMVVNKALTALKENAQVSALDKELLHGDGTSSRAINIESTLFVPYRSLKNHASGWDECRVTEFLLSASGLPEEQSLQESAIEAHEAPGHAKP